MEIVFLFAIFFLDTHFYVHAIHSILLYVIIYHIFVSKAPVALHHLCCPSLREVTVCFGDLTKKSGPHVYF